jgi:hypothetical protein
MELDLSSLWSLTLPIWGLFILILFLGGVVTTPVILEGIEQAGGVRRTGKLRRQ